MGKRLPRRDHDRSLRRARCCGLVHAENSEDTTHPVRQKQPNPWGTLRHAGERMGVVSGRRDRRDKSGEVGRAYSRDPAVDPLLVPTKEHSNRVVRGGSWSDDAQYVRAAYRNAYSREDRFDDLGFSSGPRSSVGGADPSAGGAGRCGARDARSVGRRPNGVLASHQSRRTLPTTAPSIIETDLMSVELESFEQPDWAHGVGQDRFGLFADVEVEPISSSLHPVSFRLRWLPPGRFMMGSPEDEEGRDEREGPQHQVTLTQGFWLADAPCTQALWTAVTGENPSELQRR